MGYSLTRTVPHFLTHYFCISAAKHFHYKPSDTAFGRRIRIASTLASKQIFELCKEKTI